MPRVSIFTPTHNTAHLPEAYQSLQAQTFSDWEWIVVANGRLTERPSNLPLTDERIRATVEPYGLRGVGALKRWAVEQCTGDILVELDHDDLLAPQALERIVAAVDAGAGFVYSDFANFREDRTCELYDPRYGWLHYPTIIGEQQYIAHKAFPVNASSLSAIFYAPNHVRAWTRDAYAKTGGYDSSLQICDDYDLVIRTYLAGIEMTHVPECLYLYRLHGDGSNTYLKRNAEIQVTQQAISDKYRHLLIREWCRRESLPLFDLGGGHSPAEGFSSIDILPHADVVHDIRDGLPFADNTIGAIRAYDFLEHVPHCQSSRCTHSRARCTVALMNEIYRVLVPGGWLLTNTPSTDGRGAFQDPTHCSWWNVPNSFWYYTRAQQQQYVPGAKAKFWPARYMNWFPNEWCKTHNIVYGLAELVALKGQRQCGEVEI